MSSAGELLSYEDHEIAMAINRKVGIGIKTVAATEAGVSVLEFAISHPNLGLVAGIGSAACLGVNLLNSKLRKFGENMSYTPPVVEQ
jgi:drug/metabolite transporter (DMT)-like permease